MEHLAVFISAALLGALIGWSLAFGNRRKTAWPLVTVILASVGLMRVFTHSPEPVTEFSALESIGAFTRGAALTLVAAVGAAGGWRAGGGR